MSGSCRCRGAGALRTGGVVRLSKAERKSSPSSADARASGVAVAAARLATGLGTTDTTCSGAPGEGGGGAACRASEGCTAEGRGAAVATSPSLDDEDDGGATAVPPGAALELRPESADCGIGQGEAVRQGEAGKNDPFSDSPHRRRFFAVARAWRSLSLSSDANTRSGACVFSAAWSSRNQNGLTSLVSPSNAGGFASDLKTAA